MRKEKILCILSLMLSLYVTGCGTKNETFVNANSISNTGEIEEGNEDSSPVGDIASDPQVSNESNMSDETTADKGHIEADDKTDENINLSGYLDEDKEFEYLYRAVDFNNKDFDGDGLYDRVYREVYRDSSNLGVPYNRLIYRIDFGNGEVLDLGTFTDITLGPKIIAADFTGDVGNEILFVGFHDTSTNSRSCTIIAVFQYTDHGYEQLYNHESLEIANNDYSEEKSYYVGYDVYAKNNTENEVTLYSDDIDFEKTIAIERDDYNNNEYYLDGDVISNFAWDAEIEQLEDKTALVLYQSIGSRNFTMESVKITCIWDKNEFVPIKMEVVNREYTW